MTQPQAAVIVVRVPQAGVTAGSSVTLSAIAKDATGEKINGADISFESDNTNVATVDKSGLVRAIANGDTTITVRSGSAVAAFTLLIG